MKIFIRKSKLSELSIIMEWRMRVLKEVFCLNENYDMTKLYIENESYYREHLQNDSHTAVFAYNNKQIIGCGGICYQTEMPSPDNFNGKCGYLMNIYTLPEYRRMGVGRQIVEFLIRDAINHNICKLSLESSDIAEKLYHNMNFEKNTHFYLRMILNCCHFLHMYIHLSF